MVGKRITSVWRPWSTTSPKSRAAPAKNQYGVTTQSQKYQDEDKSDIKRNKKICTWFVLCSAFPVASCDSPPQTQQWFPAQKSAGGQAGIELQRHLGAPETVWIQILVVACNEPSSLMSLSALKDSIGIAVKLFAGSFLVSNTGSLA